MEIAVLSKQIDIFISYRRRNGNQMASLLKVLLQLRGYKVKQQKSIILICIIIEGVYRRRSSICGSI